MKPSDFQERATEEVATFVETAIATILAQIKDLQLRPFFDGVFVAVRVDNVVVFGIGANDSNDAHDLKEQVKKALNERRCSDEDVH